eukprot:TRINITY_DN48793_c0_g1_i1.p1 TRINITY_DN48793_c0_g1~~TRINITY_DN48793_c0_g1_i1.p1  ORF type:complete len:400 (+),score=49.51 TRINITY_DN48793_c0_g1_i1:67-1266(+)
MPAHSGDHDKRRPHEHSTHDLEVGLFAFEASAAAAKAAVLGLQRELDERAASVRARDAEKDGAIDERVRLSRRRLAEPAAKICGLEANRHDQEVAIQDLRQELDERCLEPWPAPAPAVAANVVAAARPRAIAGDVVLSVGGKLFMAETKKLRAGSAWFGAVLSGEFPLPLGLDGSVFIDRDFTHFQLVLDYLHLGLSSVSRRLSFLTKSERWELLEETAFYRLPQLAGAAAQPSVGTTVNAKIASQELASIQEPVYNGVCGSWHPPGVCGAQPVACGVLGTATVPCIVRGYRHRGDIANSAAGSLVGNANGTFAALNSGAACPFAHADASDCGITRDADESDAESILSNGRGDGADGEVDAWAFATASAGPPRWELEFHGHTLWVEEEQIEPEPPKGKP